jgi:excisionase family DNA binding protein
VSAKPKAQPLEKQRYCEGCLPHWQRLLAGRVREDEAEVIPERTAFGEPLLDAQQVADALGMTRRWVYAQVEENGLPAYKLGRSLALLPAPP